MCVDKAGYDTEPVFIISLDRADWELLDNPLWGLADNRGRRAVSRLWISFIYIRVRTVPGDTVPFRKWVSQRLGISFGGGVALFKVVRG